MVTRSTLDPIEEARARVRLKYQRRRSERKDFVPVGLSATKKVRKLKQPKLAAIKTLQAYWRDIVGDQLYRYCRPEKLQGGRDGRELVLTVLSSAAPIVQHESERIRELASIAAGGDITSISLNHGSLTSADASKSRRRRFNTLTPKQNRQLKDATKNIEDDKLRQALVALGAAVLTAEDD